MSEVLLLFSCFSLFMDIWCASRGEPKSLSRDKVFVIVLIIASRGRNCKKRGPCDAERWYASRGEFK